jgi:succinate dehydrogenase / fumarate reductase, membrane anchor subunit
MSGDRGTGHFIQQRATAIANVPLVMFLVWFVVSHLGASRADVVATLQNPLTAILLVLSFLSILWHMRLGLQMVLEDYVHDAATLKLALRLNGAFVSVLGLLLAYSIFKMSFGS